MRDTAAEAGTRHGGKRQEAESGGWRGWAKYRLTVLHAGRGDVERLQEIGDTANNSY